MSDSEGTEQKNVQASGSRVTSDSDSSRFPGGLLRNPIVVATVTAAVTGLVVFVACFMVWYHVGGSAWRSWKSVEEAQLIAPDRLSLKVISCEGAPQLSELAETEVDIQVKLYVHFSAIGIRLGGPPAACVAHVEVRLSEPLGNRLVVDMHTGQSVSVTTGYGPVLTSPPPGVGSGGMDSPVRGTLVFDESTGCLYLDGSPVVWPAGATWQADPPAVKIHGQLIEPGMKVKGGGGSIGYDFVKAVAGEAVADAAYECIDWSLPHPDISFFNQGSRVDVVP